MQRISVVLVAITWTTWLAGTAEAQWVRTARPVQRLDRWLGVGTGHGYHWRNPGMDSSWYNPWSPLNSTLYSAPPVYPSQGYLPPQSGVHQELWPAPTPTFEVQPDSGQGGRSGKRAGEPTPAQDRDKRNGRDGRSGASSSPEQGGFPTELEGWTARYTPPSAMRMGRVQR